MKSTVSMLFVLATALLLSNSVRAGYADGMNQYAAYHVMHGGLDPSGMIKIDSAVSISKSGLLSIPYELENDSCHRVVIVQHGFLMKAVDVKEYPSDVPAGKRIAKVNLNKYLVDKQARTVSDEITITIGSAHSSETEPDDSITLDLWGNHLSFKHQAAGRIALRNASPLIKIDVAGGMDFVTVDAENGHTVTGSKNVVIADYSRASLTHNGVHTTYGNIRGTMSLTGVGVWKRDPNPPAALWGKDRQIIQLINTKTEWFDSSTDITVDAAGLTVGGRALTPSIVGGVLVGGLAEDYNVEEEDE